jgi:hypothetical protein
MRALLSLSLAALLLLGGCPGSVITPLPDGFGPGTYAGQFEAENGSGDFTTAGTLTLSVDGSGVVSGSGTLHGSSVEVTGLLNANGELDGTISDTLTQFSGRFDGQLSASVLSGDFRLPQEGGDDLTGVWDAQLQ